MFSSERVRLQYTVVPRGGQTTSAWQPGSSKKVPESSSWSEGMFQEPLEGTQSPSLMPVAFPSAL